MNDNTNPQQSQMTPDEAKASMGMATTLQDQLMPKAPMPSQAPENAPQQAKLPPKQEDTNSELNGIKQQIISLKQEIEKALKDDNEPDQTSAT